MATERVNDADVIIIGGGPAGTTLGTFLARDGIKTIILEKDIHPRDHVGESLTPSTNLIFKELGVLDKINDAGFVHKPGTGWNAPRSCMKLHRDLAVRVPNPGRTSALSRTTWSATPSTRC